MCGSRKQPTFTRFIFELPELTGVTTDRGKDKFTLKFARPLRFDLADAKLGSADGVGAIDASLDLESSEVKFSFSGPVDVRSFREDFNFVVDVSALDAKPTPSRRCAAMPSPRVLRRPASPLAGVEAPQTVPAKAVPEAAPSAAAPRQPPPGVAPSRSAPRHRCDARRRRRATAALAKSRPWPEKQPPWCCEKIELCRHAAGGRAMRRAHLKSASSLAEQAAAAAATAARRAATPRRNAPVVAELRRQGDNIRVLFPFGTPTPAAMFQRAQTLWLVFDTSGQARRRVLTERAEPQHPQRRDDARRRRAGGAPAARAAAARQRRGGRRRLGAHASAIRCRIRPSH